MRVRRFRVSAETELGQDEDGRSPARRRSGECADVRGIFLDSARGGRELSAGENELHGVPLPQGKVALCASPIQPPHLTPDSWKSTMEQQ